MNPRVMLGAEGDEVRQIMCATTPTRKDVMHGEPAETLTLKSTLSTNRPSVIAIKGTLPGPPPHHIIESLLGAAPFER